MKVIPLAILLLLNLVQYNVQAQNSVRLNVRLHPVQILTINPSHQDQASVDQSNDCVDIAFERTNCVVIYSTNGFQIKVSSGYGDEQKGPYNNVSIQVSSKSNSLTLENIVFSKRHMSDDKQSIIASGRGGFNKQYSVSYKAIVQSKDNISNYSSLHEEDNPLPHNILYTIVSQ